jgi:hypothetical protein
MEEANQCARWQKSGHELAHAQVQHYLAQGLPVRGNLIESNVLLRRQHDSRNIEMHQLWWEEIKRWSPRDQISFPWAVHQTRFEYVTMPGSSRGTNPYFLNLKHGRGLSLRDRARAYRTYARTALRGVLR